MRPTLMHRFLASLPFGFAREAEAQSRRWWITCPDGHARDLWEAGRSRIGGVSAKTVLAHCPECGRRRWCQVHRAPVG